MLCRFNILLKKEHGFERPNESIVLALESSGWKANRSDNVDYIVISTSKIHNLFKNREELVKNLKKLLTKTQLERCIVVEVDLPRKT